MNVLLMFLLFLISGEVGVTHAFSHGNATINGNAGGAVCVFPFKYEDIWHSKCTSVGHDKPWCATTNDYTRDGRWGECTGLVNPTMNGNAAGEECSFPFVYKDTAYWECTSVAHDKPWCATTDDYTRDGRWGECIRTGNPTINGNAGGALCVFPFKYKGIWHSKCTSVRHDKPWCATTDDYTRDGRWGECTGLVNPTMNGNAAGEECSFPFVYKDTAYSKCTSVRHDKPWCATTNDYTRDGRWGECTGLVTPFLQCSDEWM
ncbi:72 kDa type IV collagenase-like isoform X2 [Sardina pilchardus]|uniref:72 kDa type IV collagenase-like isoform X2 n=1 Tax=Sardina pilchardus TaxID=27697 RepID=UPI002E143584